MPNPDLASERREFEAHAREQFQWGDEELEQSPHVVFPHYKFGPAFSGFKFWLARSAIPTVKLRQSGVCPKCGNVVPHGELIYPCQSCGYSDSAKATAALSVDTVKPKD